MMCFFYKYRKHTYGRLIMAGKFRGITWNNARFGPKIQVRRSIDLAELGDFGSIIQATSDLPTRGAAAGGNTNQGGGGVGLYGLGNTATSPAAGGSGGDNSGGNDGGSYGGGAGGGTTFANKGQASHGAVRIVWNGNSSFPSTNVGLSDDEQYAS